MVMVLVRLGGAGGSRGEPGDLSDKARAQRKC